MLMVMNLRNSWGHIGDTKDKTRLMGRDLEMLVQSCMVILHSRWLTHTHLLSTIPVAVPHHGSCN